MDWRDLIDYVPILGQQKQIASDVYGLINRDTPQQQTRGGAIGKLPMPIGDASGKLPAENPNFGGGQGEQGAGGNWDTNGISPQIKSYLLNKRAGNGILPKKGFDMGNDLQEMQNLNSQTPQATPQKQQMPIPEAQETPEKGSNEKLNKWLAILGGGMVAGGGGQGAAQMFHNLDTIRAREIETDLNNPMSKESIHARQLAKKMYGDQYEVNPKLTARQFKEASPVMDELYNRTYQQRQEEKADKRYATEQDFRKQQAGENKRQFDTRMALDASDRADRKNLNWARFGLLKQSRDAASDNQRMSMRQGGSSDGRRVGTEPSEFGIGNKESERKAFGFFDRMKKSNQDLKDLENKFISNKTGGYSPSGINIAPIERLKSNERKIYESKMSDWIAANLRDQSGAAIGEPEYERDKKMYFPQPGDAAQVVAEKQKMRDTMERNMAIKSGMNSRNIESQTGTIRLTKNGKIYEMPISDAEEALSEGFMRAD